VTPAVEAAKEAGIDFRLHEYDAVELGDGDYALAVAVRLEVDPQRLFKTLVVSVEGRLQVFVVPADRRLSLRAAGKRAELAGRTEAERATGYVVGAISPLGQRRALPVTIDASALEHETVLVSAGRRGLQIELAPGDLVRLTGAGVRSLTAGE
jgi:Cys-tRNA(Pro)/Cys-tRNA(Cys) deacylase